MCVSLVSLGFLFILFLNNRPLFFPFHQLKENLVPRHYQSFSVWVSTHYLEFTKCFFLPPCPEYKRISCFGKCLIIYSAGPSMQKTLGLPLRKQCTRVLKAQKETAPKSFQSAANKLCLPLSNLSLQDS